MRRHLATPSWSILSRGKFPPPWSSWVSWHFYGVTSLSWLWDMNNKIDSRGAISPRKNPIVISLLKVEADSNLNEFQRRHFISEEARRPKSKSSGAFKMNCCKNEIRSNVQQTSQLLATINKTSWMISDFSNGKITFKAAPF